MAAPLFSPVDEPEHDFLHYLICDLPSGYPLKTPISRLLTPALTISSRRDLLHQQARFLDWAKQFLGAQPWIAYLAAVKHEAVLIAIPTSVTQLVDVVDIHFFNELQQKGRELREASRAMIDEATAQNCDRLVLLQSEAAQIEGARKSIDGAIQAGFTAVEPLPPAPELTPGRGPLRYFIAAALACLVICAVIPPNDGGMAWGLIGLVVTVIVGVLVIRKRRARMNSQSAELKAYLRHEKYLMLCRQSLALVLALPVETRKSALVNLPPCLAALEALPQERETLEAAYIKPFVPR